MGTSRMTLLQPGELGILGAGVSPGGRERPRSEGHILEPDLRGAEKGPLPLCR